MKRTFISFLFLLTFVFFPNFASAYDVHIGNLYYNLNGTNAVVTYATTSYNSYSGNISIPSSITSNGTIYKVVEVGENAFNGCTSLTSVTIPSSVKKINRYSFYNCNKITSITIPASVDTLFQSCFRNCSSLSTVTFLGDSIWIHKNAFRECRAIKRVDIKSVDFLLHSYFYESESNPIFYAKGFYINGAEVTELIIPEGTKSIPSNTFSGCSNLISVSFPSSLSSVGGFSGCSSLQEIIIPENVTTIENSAFSGATNLMSVTFLSHNGITVGNDAFMYCTKINRVSFDSEAVIAQMSYGNGAANPVCYSKKVFVKNKEIKRIKIPHGVTRIGMYAFYNCENLESVKIPSSVKTIGEGAFYNCSNLSAIYLPESITSIGDYAFCNLRSLRYMNIPKKLSLTYVRRNACDFYRFNSCSGIAYIDKMPTSTNDNNEKAWFVDSRYKEVVIGDNVKSICDYSFEGTHLNKVTLSKNIEEIRRSSFGAGVDTVVCHAVIPPVLITNSGINSYTTKLYVPAAALDLYKSDESWGTFEYIYPITDEVIEFKDYEVRDICLSHFDANRNGNIEMSEAARVKSLGSIFTGKDIGRFDELKYFTGLTTIPANCFANCTYLESVLLPSTIESIEDNAFYGCISLTSAELNEGLTTIGTFAFKDCGNLSKINLPQSIRLIRDYAFYNCKSLGLIDCKAVVPPTTKEFVFKNVDMINCKVMVPSSAEATYKNIYPWSLFWSTTPEEIEKIHENLEYDVNDDSKIDIKDVDICSNMVVGADSPHPYADINKDGAITISDVTALVDKINGNVKERVLTDKTIIISMNYMSQPVAQIPKELQSEIKLITLDNECVLVNGVTDAVLDIYVNNYTSNKTFVYDGVKECNIHLNNVNH